MQYKCLNAGMCECVSEIWNLESYYLNITTKQAIQPYEEERYKSVTICHAIKLHTKAINALSWM